MIKELKFVFFILTISFFLIFTTRYYFSDENKKNMFRFSNNIDNKIESISENLLVLENDTDEIIKYVENENINDEKKFFFWKLLNNND